MSWACHKMTYQTLFPLSPQHTRWHFWMNVELLRCFWRVVYNYSIIFHLPIFSILLPLRLLLLTWVSKSYCFMTMKFNRKVHSFVLLHPRLMAQIWEGENKIEKLSVVQAVSKKSGCDKKNLELKKGGLRLFIWFDLFRSTEYTRGLSVFHGTLYGNKIVVLWKYVIVFKFKFLTIQSKYRSKRFFVTFLDDEILSEL